MEHKPDRCQSFEEWLNIINCAGMTLPEENHERILFLMKISWDAGVENSAMWIQECGDETSYNVRQLQNYQ